MQSIAPVLSSTIYWSILQRGGPIWLLYACRFFVWCPRPLVELLSYINIKEESIDLRRHQKAILVCYCSSWRLLNCCCLFFFWWWCQFFTSFLLFFFSRFPSNVWTVNVDPLDDDGGDCLCLFNTSSRWAISDDPFYTDDETSSSC